MLRRAAAITLLLTACGGDDPAPEPLAARLSDGTEVVVDETGSIRLSLDGRVLFASDGPIAKRFDETFTSTLGTWIFSREGEEAIPIGSYAGAEKNGDQVVVRYTGSGLTAELTITPGEGEVSELRWLVSGGALEAVAIPVACDAEASFYGFGEQYNATDQRGEVFTLLVTEQGIGRDPKKPPSGLNGGPHTTYFPMPYWLDARGHGVLVETSQRVNVDLCQADPAVAEVEVVDDAPVEMVVFHGPRPADVVRELQARVGRPTAPPSWAYDLWVGSQGGRDAVLAEVDALEAAQIPFGALWVQDWTGQRPNFDGGFGVQYRWRPDLDFYPDLAGMIADLHSRGYRFLSYANPFIDPALEHFPDMDAQGLLIHDSLGESYVHLAPNGTASHPDLTNEASRDYVKGFLRAMVEDLGMDGWMSDFGEWVPLDAVLADGSDPIAYHNEFPVHWHRLWREVMDDARPDGDFCVFARSGFTGVQAVSQIHWVGDQEATFSPYDGLPTVVPAMLNLGLSGVPFVTHDIAGFSGGPSTKELWLRWVELGAFTTIMRTHEGNDKENNWSWEKDAESTSHFRRFARVHAALKGELLAIADEAVSTSLPMVRHLLLMYPDDPEARRIDDQYLLGPDLLVAPVVVEGATTRRLYLPEGPWFHVWTGEAYEGGGYVEIDAPIGSPPVFARGADRADLRAISE
ncbi:MAG: hypothetical protein KC731_33505 [Myxococcales bacterium]|nr:hypothetical protein [Myxococcales bacterium]